MDIRKIASAAKVFLSRKGFDGAPAALVISFVVLVIIAAIGAQVTQQIKDSLTANSAAANVSEKGLTALSNYAGLLPVVGTVLAAVLIITLVLLGFARARTRGG